MDLEIVWDNNQGFGDWQLDNGDLASGDDLTSAVLVSLFTDRYATSDFLPWDSGGDNRGWWGNTFEGAEIGSSLWQLDRAKFSAQPDLLLRARDHVKQALQWMIDIGLAASVSVVTSRLGTYGLGIAIVVAKPATNLKVAFRFSSFWNAPAPPPAPAFAPTRTTASPPLGQFVLDASQLG